MKNGFKIAAIVVGGKGLVVYGLGLLFRLLHWPGAAIMQLVGGFLLIISVLLIFISLMKKKNNQ
ncbi:MAG: hypothetical protein V4581_11875 [Bacteroidota bacterium]